MLGTSIDEPVVQVTSDQLNRYLYADVFGGSGYGASYIDCDCSLDGPFAIVYGHYMSDGSLRHGPFHQRRKATSVAASATTLVSSSGWAIALSAISEWPSRYMS